MEKQLIYAYTAGLIDGEGTITLTKTHSSNEFRYPVISITSTTYSFLSYMKEQFGGTISTHKSYSDKHKVSWHWTLVGSKVISLLPNIIPYMLEPNKIYRAKLIIDQYSALTPRNGKYTDKMREDKHKFEYDFFHPSNTIDF